VFGGRAPPEPTVAVHSALAGFRIWAPEGGMNGDNTKSRKGRGKRRDKQIIASGSTNTELAAIRYQESSVAGSFKFGLKTHLFAGM